MITETIDETTGSHYLPPFPSTGGPVDPTPPVRTAVGYGGEHPHRFICPLCFEKFQGQTSSITTMFTAHVTGHFQIPVLRSVVEDNGDILFSFRSSLLESE